VPDGASAANHFQIEVLKNILGVGHIADSPSHKAQELAVAFLQRRSHGLVGQTRRHGCLRRHKTPCSTKRAIKGPAAPRCPRTRLTPFAPGERNSVPFCKPNLTL
jgi:hypothetical protein